MIVVTDKIRQATKVRNHVPTGALCPPLSLTLSHNDICVTLELPCQPDNRSHCHVNIRLGRRQGVVTGEKTEGEDQYSADTGDKRDLLQLY